VLNTVVKRGTVLLFLALLTSVASASEPESTPESEVYIPPIDVRLELAQLSPLYTIEQERLPYEPSTEFIGVDFGPRRILPDLEFREPADRGMLFTFYLLQVLDVATTAYAVDRFDCVREVNPMLPHKPSVEELILFKSLPLWFIHSLEPTTQELAPATGITAAVVANNFDVIYRARRSCP